MKNNQNGITLVALVITIIILLILAGISISNLTGNGLFGKVQDAKVADQVGKIQEGINLWKMEHEMSKYTEMNTRDLETFLQDLVEDKLLTEEQVNEVLSSERKEIEIGGKTLSFLGTLRITDTADTKPSQAMPTGAIVIENNASKGIVIEDKNGNEWTWVEVPKTKVFTTATGADQYDNIKANLISYATDYRENNYIDEWYDYYGTIYDGMNQYSQVKYITSSDTFTNAKNYYGTIYTDKGITEETEYVSGTKYYADITEKLTDTSGCGLTFNDYQINYQKMLSSVYTNGGFWISRYEIGDSTATKNNETRTSSSGTTGTAVSQANQIPYNWVTCSQAQILASGMSTDISKTTGLLFGIQWDLTCKFIEEKTDLEVADINSDSTSWGNYKNSSLTLNRGKYNIKPSNSTSVWTLYTTDTESYITNKQTSNDESYYQLLTTGASEDTNKMNIYDFAGNVSEWTLEYDAVWAGNPCVYRGGSFHSNGSNSSASIRYMNNTEHSFYNIGFHATLY